MCHSLTSEASRNIFFINVLNFGQPSLRAHVTAGLSHLLLPCPKALIIILIHINQIHYIYLYTRKYVKVIKIS